MREEHLKAHSSRPEPESKPIRQKYRNFIFCIEQTEQNEKRKQSCILKGYKFITHIFG
jgi:hypothetical protein